MTSLLWLIAHGKVMTNAERGRRGFTTNCSCALCGHLIEDIDHIWRWCAVTSSVWTYFLSTNELLDFNGLTTWDWLFSNLNGKMNCGAFEDWLTTFAVIIRWTWKWRNEAVF